MSSFALKKYVLLYIYVSMRERAQTSEIYRKLCTQNHFNWERFVFTEIRCEREIRQIYYFPFFDVKKSLREIFIHHYFLSLRMEYLCMLLILNWKRFPNKPNLQFCFLKKENFPTPKLFFFLIYVSRKKRT